MGKRFEKNLVPRYTDVFELLNKVATSLPSVASHATQNFDFLKVIFHAIKIGPDEHSESHTGILANCLAQKHIDPGLLKPVIQTILKLLKSTQSVTNCLRIIAVVSQTPRGAEILLQEKTDLYLRVLIQQQTNQDSLGSNFLLILFLCYKMTQ